MIRIVLLVLVVAVLVALVFVVANGQATSSRRLELARRRVRAATELAYDHDEISPHLAGAIIERTRGLGDDSSVHTLEKAVEDVLALARAHRTEEPDLAVIVIDVLRREVPRELG